MTSQTGYQAIVMHILPNITQEVKAIGHKTWSVNRI